MKKLIALALIFMLCLTTAYAAEWREGLSPNKPSTHSKEVDFKDTIGHFMMWPSPKLPAELFCDVLVMYLPRTDIEVGEGKITLYDADGEVAVMDCADPAQVELRELVDIELEDLMWGSGSSLMIHLPVSLEFDREYYVLMDAGCIVDPVNDVKSLEFNQAGQWVPVLQSDYGIGSLSYTAPEAEGEGVAYTTYDPKPGDTIQFNLKLGGDAKEAVIFTENDSVYFDPFQFTESGTVTGTVIGEDVSWGIAFLDENNEQLYDLILK